MFPEELMHDEIARRALRELASWLREDAYPVWSQQGWDNQHGGFHERLSANGPLVCDLRRARVQLRQIYAFARAPSFGWTGDMRRLVADGIAQVTGRYMRPDGLVRVLVAPDGTVADNRALLYDQAFALLAFAAAQRVLGPDSRLRQSATALVDRIQSVYKRSGPGFRSESTRERPLSSNPHMHLLEAALAWRRESDDYRWSRLLEDLVTLALEHLIDPHTGALREHVEVADTDYTAVQGRLVEPGHQFEWAWLLLRASVEGTTLMRRDSARKVHTRLLAAARRLVEVGESYGVHDQVVINAILDDMTVHDPEARLWPQTERLKAHALMARLTGEPHHWRLAGEAAQTLERYLDTGARGLWYDRRRSDGSFVAEASPASSFYHIVCAIGELASALETTLA